jgi:20S proteasome subunit beta 2
MSVKTPIEGPSTGFDFTNYARNQFLGERFGGLPKGEF